METATENGTREGNGVVRIMQSPQGIRIKAILEQIDLKGDLKKMFPNVRFLKGHEGRFSVFDHYPSQPNVIVVFVDCSWTDGFDPSKADHLQDWKHWTTNFAFCDKDVAMCDDERLMRFLAMRYESAMNKLRLTALGEQNEVEVPEREKSD